MALTELCPMLLVDDVLRSREFYVGSLGFECTNEFEYEGELTWCNLERDSARLMITDGPPLPGGKARTTAESGLIVYLYTDAIERDHAELVARGVEVSDLRDTMYGMREFTVCDPDGNEIFFGQDTVPGGSPESQGGN